MMSEKICLNNPTRTPNKIQVAQGNYFRKLNYASTTFNNPHILPRNHALLFSARCPDESMSLSKIPLSKHYSYLHFSKHHLCNSHPNMFSSKSLIFRHKGVNPSFKVLNNYFLLSLINLKGTNRV